MEPTLETFSPSRKAQKQLTYIYKHLRCLASDRCKHEIDHFSANGQVILPLPHYEAVNPHQVQV